MLLTSLQWIFSSTIRLLIFAKISPSDFYMELDMQTGILRRTFTVSLAGATVKFTFERLF